MIWEDMKESLIFRDLQVSDNKEALEILGNAMLQEGYVTEDFPVAVCTILSPIVTTAHPPFAFCS